MKKTHKFSHSVAQGGYLYAHKTLNSRIIENKQGLRNFLNALSQKFKLIDITIKIYDTIFFFFFMTKPSVKPFEIIEKIQKDLNSFALWDQEHIYTTLYDLQEEYLREYLKRHGFDYDKG